MLISEGPKSNVMTLLVNENILNYKILFLFLKALFIPSNLLTNIGV